MRLDMGYRSIVCDLAVARGSGKARDKGGRGRRRAARALSRRHLRRRGGTFREVGLSRLSGVLEHLGASKPLILRDEVTAEVVGETPFEGITGAFYVDSGGECSEGEIDRVSSRAQEEGADAVVGVGGGR